MPMSARFCLMIVLALSLSAIAEDAQRDTDGDGIRDQLEELLGTDPGAPDVFHPIRDDGLESDAARGRDTYDPSKDFTKIEFCHAGEDRYLWRATFAEPPRLADTVFHLYVDSNADATTGRKGSENAASTGTDYMLSVVGDRANSSHYDAEGNSTTGPPVTFAVDGKTLLVSADVDLGRDENGIRFDLYVLCHTITASGDSVKMSDSTGKGPVERIRPVDRKKLIRPRDHVKNFRVDATFGLPRIRQALSAPGTIVIRHDELELDGYVEDLYNVRRWPHVKQEAAGGKVRAKAPKAGRYHVGFMMYDDSNDERIVISVENQLQGVAVATADNNRTWLYWLDEAREFRGGETVQLEAGGSSSKHAIINIVFLAEEPEPRELPFLVENMTSAVHVGRPGRVTVSWTTTWPCPTRFEYGTEAAYGKLLENETNCMVHRVVLEELQADTQYHGRAVGTAKDGSAFLGDDYVFTATIRKPPATAEGLHSVALTVGNPHSFALSDWPVTTGVPFPRGRLADLDRVRLMSDDNEMAAQVSLAARWPDGSVKWLLVSFQAELPGGGQSNYQLQFGSRVDRKDAEKGISIQDTPDGISVDTGTLSFLVDKGGNLADIIRDGKRLTPPGEVCRTAAQDADGNPYTTAGQEARLEIEELGPLRAVIKATSRLVDSKGKSLLRIEKRIEAYRGRAFLRVHHTFVVDNPDTFTNIDRLAYRVPTPAGQTGWRIPVIDGRPLVPDAPGWSVRQQFDNQFVVVSGGNQTPTDARLSGVILADGDGGPAVALDDFWQNYPKGFSIRQDGLDIDLCPAFDGGVYDAFPFEKEGHQLYYYLLDGHYRLKQGVSKTHQLLLCFESAGQQELCRAFERPPLATAPPEWYCGSKVFYDVAPRNTERFKLYEAAIDKNIAEYARRQERQHDFGMLNYGDWYGERGTNWGNIEYDTQHAFFLEYIRSGNSDAFFLGHATELHNRDIDTVQFSPDGGQNGAVYVHQMCHVGGYYDKGVPGSLGFPRGGYTVSHAWCEGHFDHYFLTGDRRSYETGCAVADFFIRRDLGKPYDFSSTRTPGWHLIMLAAAYAATDDPYYLNAVKLVTEYVLETQDVEPRPLSAYQAEGRQPYQQGGWSRMMVPGHCQCEPRHRGNAGFMIAVLLSGLKYYHDVTGDERVKEAIIRGAYNLLDETYSDEAHGFRYTSCPNGRFRPGSSPLMAEGIARAYLWTRDDRFRRVLTEALPISAGGSPYGKSFSMYYRMAPRVLADMDAAGITFDRAVSSEQ